MISQTYTFDFTIREIQQFQVFLASARHLPLKRFRLFIVLQYQPTCKVSSLNCFNSLAWMPGLSCEKCWQRNLKWPIQCFNRYCLVEGSRSVTFIIFPSQMWRLFVPCFNIRSTLLEPCRTYYRCSYSGAKSPCWEVPQAFFFYILSFLFKKNRLW